MKKQSIFQKATAALLAVAIAIPPVFADAGTVKIDTQQTLGDGLTYSNTVSQDAAGRQEAFSFTLEPGSRVIPITVQSSGMVYGRATVDRAIELAASMGYNVYGAINTDYFAPATGIPLGIVIEDGIYKSNAGGFPAAAIVDGQMKLIESPSVNLTIRHETTGVSTPIQHLNKQRTDTGGLHILNQYFSSTATTRTSTAGWMVRMRPIDGGELTVSGELRMEVVECLRTSDSVAIGENDYILTAADQSGYGEVYDQLQVGDIAVLATSCSNQDLVDAQWATGSGDLMVKDGVLTDTTTWEHVKEGRAPRSAMGATADGRMIYYVVDGRQSGYSTGLSQVELANEMIRRGCVWAVNLDGGGSSSLSVKTPGQKTPIVVNRPSDGSNRSCATYLLLVSETTGDGQADKLFLKEDGLVVYVGSSVTLGDVFVVDNGGNPVSTLKNSDVSFDSTDRLGSLDGAVYTAGMTTGTDEIELYSSSLHAEGTAQIHVREALSAITVTRAGDTTNLSDVVVKPGEQIQFSVTGWYWNRVALRNASAAKWSISEGAGTITEDGLFVAGDQDGTITVEAGGVVKTIAVNHKIDFTDVPDGHWAYEAVRYCYNNGIVSGVSATQFGLGQNIRRGDFVLMLYRLMGSPAVMTTTTFTDVAASDYYATAISWAVEQGLASGTGGGAFGAQNSITREQAFTMINRALPLMNIYLPTGAVSSLDRFADGSSIASYAREHMATLVENGVVSGSGAHVNPTGTLTREEMAALLLKISNLNTGDRPELTGIAFAQTEINLARGESMQLTASVQPAGAAGSITWKSSDTTAVTVSPNGVITNVFAGTGEPVVTVTATSGEFSASCIVYCVNTQVQQPTPTEPDVTPPVTEQPKPETETETKPTGGIPIGTATVSGTSSGLNVRAQASTSGEIRGRLSDGTTVVLYEKLDGWYRISAIDSDNKALSGYVSADYLTLPPTGTVTDAGNGLNLREGPSTGAAIITQITNGSKVSILETMDDWYRVQLVIGEELKTGYVSSDYITID